MADEKAYDIDYKFFVDPLKFKGINIINTKTFLWLKQWLHHHLQTTIINQLNVQKGKTIYRQLFLLLTRRNLPNKNS